MRKSFAQQEATIEQLEETSDLSHSNDKAEEASYFQHGFQIMQRASTGCSPQRVSQDIPGVFHSLTPLLKAIFKQRHGKFTALDHRKLILSDNKSTCDLFCNKDTMTDSNEVYETMAVKPTRNLEGSPQGNSPRL